MSVILWQHAHLLPECHAHQAHGLQHLHAMSCTAELRLDEGPVPLRYPQLTRLQLLEGGHLRADLLATVAELRQLEVLEVLEVAGDVDTVTAKQLARLPKLRTVNLSQEPLHAPGDEAEPAGRPPRAPERESMQPEVRERLLRLQRAAPRIKWVLDGMGGCRE